MVTSFKVVLLSVLLLMITVAIVVPLYLHFNGENNSSKMFNETASISMMTAPMTYGSSFGSVTNGTTTMVATASSPTAATTSVTNAVSSTSTTQMSGNSTVTSAPIASYYSSVLNTSSAVYCRERPCFANSLYYYEAIKINVYTTGNYIIESSSSLDTYGYLYSNAFDTAYPYLNLLQSNDDGPSGTADFSLSQVLQIMTDYILVATTYSSFIVGAFSVIAQGPAAVSLSLVHATTPPTPFKSYYTSALTNNSLIFCRVGFCTGSHYYYQPIAFTTLTSGDYIIQSNGSTDTYGFIFNSTVRHISNAREAVIFDDDSGGNRQFLMAIALQSMVNYTLVVTTFGRGITGPFSVIASGIAPVSFFAL